VTEDEIMRLAMAEYDEQNPDKEETVEEKWQRFLKREYMREYRKGLRRRSRENLSR